MAGRDGAYANAYRSAAKAAVPQERIPSAAWAGVLQYIGRADRAIAAGRIPEAHEALVRAQQVVAVLHGSLDHASAPALVDRLAPLYAFIMAELGRANMEKSRERLKKLIPIVLPLREAWEGAADAVLGQTAIVQGGTEG